MPERIDILLAVFNGERYLGEQIDSLLGQTDGNWSLLVRDDGSTDGSVALASEYQRRHPGRIRLIGAASPFAGALGNYSALLDRSSAGYVMFCDQDDVWLPGKIALTRAKMKALEDAWGGDAPLLVHTDMRVTDARLCVVAESLWRYQKSDPEAGSSLNRLLLQNCATGCSVMINRRLRELAQPIPREAMMHDWWLALVAAAFGRIGHLAEPTLMYRQHGENDTGAKRWSLCNAVGQLVDPASRSRILAERRTIAERIRGQATAFSERYAERLTRGQREMVETFVHLDEAPPLLRRRLIVKYGFFYTGLARNIGRLVFG
jgi:glycosyltransferase involved in cell wall biosynthesis